MKAAERHEQQRQDWIARQISAAPPLTQEQIDAIRRINARRPVSAPPARSTPEPPAEVRTAVYWHYDADDVLLYVGISNDPVARTRTHSRRSYWSTWAVRSEVRWFDGKREALDAESAAIRADRPLFNGTCNDAPDLRERQVRYLLERNAFDLLKPDLRQRP